MILTPEQVKEILERVEQCAPGPWLYDGDNSVELACPVRPDWGKLMLYTSESGADDTAALSKEELAFIAAARTDVPKLCASHEQLRTDLNVINDAYHQMTVRLEQEIERLKTELEWARDSLTTQQDT